jgi:uncharacterized protein YprB with RNaseH-like and TPR domain
MKNLNVNKLGHVQSKNELKINKIVPVGLKVVYGLQTSTKTYIVEGFGSHNTMISWAVKPLNGKPVAMITDKKHILSPDEDKHLLEGFIDEILKYDIICGYFSTRFDLPFARTRAFIHKLDFPAYGSINHLDLYYIARSKLCLKRRRLDTVGSVFGLKGKTYLDPTIWRRAGQGNKKALDYILDHNIKDVILTEKVYKKMEKLFKGGRKSV